MAPSTRTVPGTTSAIAASTAEIPPWLIDDRLDRLATVSAALATHCESMRPAWLTGSPISATFGWLTSCAKTCELLRMYCRPRPCTRDPSVPEQQYPLAMSVALPPEVPSWIGRACRSL